MASRVIPVDPFDLVVFGGTGDLARRKILPALFRRYVAGQIEGDVRLIGAARSEMDAKAYREMVREAILEFGGEEAGRKTELAAFLKMLDYVTLDAKGTQGWADLAAKMRADRIRAFYFSGYDPRIDCSTAAQRGHCRTGSPSGSARFPCRDNGRSGKSALRGNAAPGSG